MIKIVIAVSLVVLFSGCTPSEQNAINRALHDSNVELERENQANLRAQRCKSGFYYTHYGSAEQYRMCGSPYVQQIK